MAQYEPIVGRYLKLDLGGRPHRLYVEEAGAGIPLVCLHTAGADNRQWRHLLNDAEITRHFRVLAFDMPWHGKSLPPVGWQDEEYRLTTQGYIDLVMTFIRTLGLEDRLCVVTGSTGGIGRAVAQLLVEEGAKVVTSGRSERGPGVGEELHVVGKRLRRFPAARRDRDRGDYAHARRRRRRMIASTSNVPAPNASGGLACIS